MNSEPLAGRRIVIVEDDYFQAEDSRRLLERAGAQIVAIAATTPDLAELLALGSVDAGLIDINLGRTHSLDFARALRDHAIPFVFLTGYDAAMLPEDLADGPCISKPADSERIVAELCNLMLAREG
ncbi:response regulator [Erythrobacter sp. NFXS35]|uniref:response regulator n=1 Tax=Erythrobacter sp. NFXS35 TaxID=2818436 RepID=UPI0032DF146F